VIFTKNLIFLPSDLYISKIFITFAAAKGMHMPLIYQGYYIE